MTNQYSFPRVSSKIEARRRVSTTSTVVDSITPVLFIPIVSNKGPLNEVKLFTSLADFVETYGEASYEKQGQAILNAYNFLGATPYRGNVLAVRIDSALDAIAASSDGRAKIDNVAGITFKHIEQSALYNQWKIYIRQIGTANNYTIKLINENGTAIKTLTAVTFDTPTSTGNYRSRLAELTYVVEVTYASQSILHSAVSAYVAAIPTQNEYKIPFSGGVGGILTLTAKDIEEEVRKFYKDKAMTLIGDKLLHPITVILDAGYTLATKGAIINFINNEDIPSADRRDDINFFADTFASVYNVDGSFKMFEDKSAEMIGDGFTYTDNGQEYSATYPENGCVPLFAPQPLRVDDPEVGKTIIVTPTYEIAYKFVFNAGLYGIWTNMFGVGRGKLALTELVTPITNSQKDWYFKNRINYIEKTIREESFAGNITTGKKETAYEEIHVAVLTQYIRRELQFIGREYIYEYNDVDTDTYEKCYQKCILFMNKFAGQAIESYNLEVFKLNEKSFAIQLSGLKYRAIAYYIDLLIELI